MTTLFVCSGGCAQRDGTRGRSAAGWSQVHRSGAQVCLSFLARPCCSSRISRRLRPVAPARWSLPPLASQSVHARAACVGVLCSVPAMRTRPGRRCCCSAPLWTAITATRDASQWHAAHLVPSTSRHRSPCRYSLVPLLIARSSPGVASLAIPCVSDGSLCSGAHRGVLCAAARHDVGPVRPRAAERSVLLVDHRRTTLARLRRGPLRRPGEPAWLGRLRFCPLKLASDAACC